MANEADTCRQYVLPRLTEAGWETDPHSITEQRTFTDGRIIVTGANVRRGKQKRADYLLRYTRDFPIAVVEAKVNYKSAGAGLGQAKDYAQILDLKFAYSTNGTGIVEFDFTTGTERNLDAFPSPQELWQRFQQATSLGDVRRSDCSAHTTSFPAAHLATTKMSRSTAWFRRSCRASSAAAHRA